MDLIVKTSVTYISQSYSCCFTASPQRSHFGHSTIKFKVWLDQWQSHWFWEPPGHMFSTELDFMWKHNGIKTFTVVCPLQTIRKRNCFFKIPNFLTRNFDKNQTNLTKCQNLTKMLTLYLLTGTCRTDLLHHPRIVWWRNIYKYKSLIYDLKRSQLPNLSSEV